MSNKRRKFKSNSRSRQQRRGVVRRVHFDRFGHLIKQDIKNLDAVNISASILTRADTFADENFVSNLANDMRSETENQFFVDDNGQELGNNAKKEAQTAIVYMGIADTSRQLFNNEDKPFTAGRFKLMTRFNIRRRLKALRDDGMSFFNQLRHNVVDKSPIRGASVIEMHRSAQIGMKAFTQKLEGKISASSDNIKSLFKRYKSRMAVAAASVSLMALTFSCTNGNPAATNNNAKINYATVNDSSDHVQNQAPTITLTQASQAYKVPVDSSRVAVKDLASTVDFLNKSYGNDNNGYEYALSRLTDTVMEKHFKDRTRDEVLNSYRYFRSFYPNADRAEQLGVSAERVQAARVAEAFHHFLCDENAQLPDDCNAMFINQIKGDRNVRGVKDPCGETVQYQKVTSMKAQTVKAANSLETKVTPSTTKTPQIVTQEQTSNDSVAVVSPAEDEDFVREETLTVDTTYVSSVQVEKVHPTYHKANEDLAPKTSSSATVEQILGLKVKDQEVYIENGEDSISSDSATVKKATSASIIDEKQTDFDDLDVVSDSIVNADVSTATVSNAENKAASASVIDETQTDFDDIDIVSDSIVNTYVSTATVSNAVSKVADEVQDTVKIEIIEGADKVPVGTPSAGYVSERGGYQNTGLTKKEYNDTKKFFGDKFQQYMDIINANDSLLLQNGQIGAGLVGEQLLFQWKQAESWSSNNPKNKNADKAFVLVNQIMENYFDRKPCAGDSLTADQTSIIRSVFDRITDTGRIFGVKGKQTVRTVNQIATEDCDTPSKHTYQATGSSRPSNIGEPHKRLFRAVTVTRDEAFVNDSTLIEHTVYVPNYQTTSTNIVYGKYNEDLVTGKVTRKATADEVLSLKVKDQDVYVEVNNTEVKENTPMQKKKKFANKVKKEKQRLEKQKGKQKEVSNSPQNNPYLTKWIENKVH